MKTNKVLSLLSALLLCAAPLALAQTMGGGGGGGGSSGAAGGDLAGTYPNPQVANVGNASGAPLPSNVGGFGTVLGLGKGDGAGNVSAAVSGTDYAAASTQLQRAVSFTLTADQWANQNTVLATAALTETFPVLNTLSVNGLQFLQNTSSGVITLAPAAASGDQICQVGGICASANASVALPAGFSAWLSTNGGSPGKLNVAVFVGPKFVTAGTTQTATAVQWATWSVFSVTTGSQTITLPPSAGLATSGGFAVQTVGQSVTLTAQGSDTINGGAAAGSVTVASGLTAFVTMPTAGAFLVSPITGGGNATTPGGSSTYAQYNASSSFGGSSGLTLSATAVTGWLGGNVFTNSGTSCTLLGSSAGTGCSGSTTANGDCGTITTFTAATAITVTLPSTLPAGCTATLVQAGAGTVTVAQGASATLNYSSSFTTHATKAQYSVVGLTTTATGVGYFFGDGQ